MNRPAVGVGVFVWKDGKFLMGLRDGSHGAKSWSVPGGWLEFGESFEDCAKREVMEETGLKIKNIRLVTITNNIFPKEKVHSITVWLESDWKSGTPKILEPHKFKDQKWHTFKDLPSPLFSPWKELKEARPDLFE
jgi:8-oxo-dGTP diphosphatase